MQGCPSQQNKGSAYAPAYSLVICEGGSARKGNPGVSHPGEGILCQHSPQLSQAESESECEEAESDSPRALQQPKQTTNRNEPKHSRSGGLD